VLWEKKIPIQSLKKWKYINKIGGVSIVSQTKKSKRGEYRKHEAF